MKKFTRFAKFMVLNLVVILASACVLTACGKKDSKKYTITWKNWDNTTVLETDKDVAEGTTPKYDGATPVRATDADNTYTFRGWTPTVVDVTADATYTAVFTAAARRYNVTVGTITGGTVTADTAAAAGGTTVTLTVTPAEGSRLKSGTLKVNNGAVTVVGTGITRTFTMPKDNVTVTAEFEEIPLGAPRAAISIDAEIINGTVVPDKVDAAEGETVTLTVTADGGYRAKSVKVNDGTADIAVAGTGNTYKFVMPATGVTVTAEFEAVYTISKSAAVNGTVTIDNTGAVQGEMVMITATPDANYVLDKIKITGNIVTTAGANNTHTFIMPGNNVTVTVTFRAAPTPFERDLDATVTAMAGVNAEQNASGELLVDGKKIEPQPPYDAMMGGGMGSTMVQKIRFDANGNTNGWYEYYGDEEFEIWKNGKMYKAQEDGDGELEYIRYDLPAAELCKDVYIPNRAEWMEEMGSFFSGAENVKKTAGGYTFDIDIPEMTGQGHGVVTVSGGKVRGIVISAQMPMGSYSLAQFAEMTEQTEENLILALQAMGAEDDIDENSTIEIVVGMSMSMDFLFTNSSITDPVPTPVNGNTWVDLYTITVKDLATNATVSMLYGYDRVSASLINYIDLPLGKVCDGLYGADKTTSVADGAYDITGNVTIYADIRTLDAKATALLTMLDKLENDTDFEVYYYENATEGDYITVLQYEIDKWGDSKMVNGYQKFSNGARAWKEFTNESGTEEYYIDGNGVYVKGGSRISIGNHFDSEALYNLPNAVESGTTVTEADGIYTVDAWYGIITVTTANGAITEINVNDSNGETEFQFFINGGESKFTARPDNVEWLPEFYTTFIYSVDGGEYDWRSHFAYITEEDIKNFLPDYNNDYEFGGFYYDADMTDALTADGDDRYFFDPAKADDREINIFVKLTPKE